MIIDIINKKRRKEELTKDEIEFAITSYLSKTITDYQMSALLMAIAINGMTERETFDLTKVMLDSGEQMDLTSISGIKLDKHSTGGVGDKTTLALVPLVAACGVKVAKMSGRSLGHTGGTIDKLESIQGFQVKQDVTSFIKQVNEIGCAVVSQTGNLVPADKALYGLRDVTGTVESIPLIASSIMSKKLASGADKIVIDVKVGTGALMKNLKDAKKLAKLMVTIGKNYGKETRCVLTNMSEPLGCAVGNSLEVLEAIAFLKGDGPDDFKELTIHFATLMVSMGLNISESKAKEMVMKHLSDGSALNKFYEMVSSQKGDVNDIPVSSRVFSIKSNKSGMITEIDAHHIGEIARKIGAGRFELTDEIDPTVGIVLTRKVGEFVMDNEELAQVYLNKIDLTIKEVLECFTVTDGFSKIEPLIYTTIK